MVWCKQASISQLPFFPLYIFISSTRLGATLKQRSSSNFRLSARIRACFSSCPSKLRGVCKRINGVTFTCLLVIHSFIKHYLHSHQATGFALMNKVGCLSQRSSTVWEKRHYQVNLYTIYITTRFYININTRFFIHTHQTVQKQINDVDTAVITILKIKLRQREIQ